MGWLMDWFNGVETSKGKTVRVKIAVAVNADGSWRAMGSNEDHPNASSRTAVKALPYGVACTVNFIEAIFSSNYYVESIHLGDVELWCSETHDSEFNIASIEKAVRARLKEMLEFFAQAKQP